MVEETFQSKHRWVDPSSMHTQTAETMTRQITVLKHTVQFLELSEGKPAKYVADSLVQQTGIIRNLRQTAKGIFFETDEGLYIQSYNPALNDDFKVEYKREHKKEKEPKEYI